MAWGSSKCLYLIYSHYASPFVFLSTYQGNVVSVPGGYGDDYNRQGQQVQSVPPSTQSFVSQEQPAETESALLTPLSQFTTLGSHSEKNNSLSTTTGINDQQPEVDKRKYNPLPVVDDRYGFGESPNFASSSEPPSVSHATSSDAYVLVIETLTVGSWLTLRNRARQGTEMLRLFDAQPQPSAALGTGAAPVADAVLSNAADGGQRTFTCPLPECRMRVPLSHAANDISEHVVNHCRDAGVRALVRQCLDGGFSLRDTAVTSGTVVVLRCPIRRCRRNEFKTSGRWARHLASNHPELIE